jgi:hypothetical protein
MNDVIFKQLAAPFAPRHISWKPGAVKGERCMALAYADLRAYMKQLDDVCGADWSVMYEPWGADRLICRLTVMGTVRSSTGETTNEAERSENGGTVAEAQAFKRACAMFGLGRYLYNLPDLWVGFDPGRKRITETGLAELNARYSAYYERTMQALRQASVKADADSDDNAEAEMKTIATPAMKVAA